MIDYEKRAMIEAEDKYTFRQSSQISSQTGLIGYLRADMDTDGNGFFGSWNDYRKDLKTDEFKQEFDEVINSLREEGDILHNRKDLAYYCYTNPQSKMPTEQDYYGVRVDTDKYTYLLRLNPNKGEYNLYCYCYVKDNSSRNGIKINGTRQNEEAALTGQMLKDGDIVSVAYVDFRFWDRNVQHVRANIAQKILDNPVNEALNGWIKEELFLDFKLNDYDNRYNSYFIRQVIADYVEYYNRERPCFAIGYDTPDNYYHRFQIGDIEQKDTFKSRFEKNDDQ